MTDSTSFTINLIVISSLWVAAVLTFFVPIPAKYAICIYILAIFMAFTNTCIAIMNRDVIKEHNGIAAYLLILLYGPLEITRLNASKVEIVSEKNNDNDQ